MMVDMQLRYGSVVGTPSSLGWSQASVQKSNEKILMLVISIANPGESSKAKIKDFIEDANRTLVDNALTESTFLTLFAEISNIADVVSAFIEDEKVVLYAKGETGVWLSRNNALSQILDGQKTGFIRGNLAISDFYVIATGEFFQLAESEIDPNLSSTEISETVATMLHSIPESGSMAAVLFDVLGEQIAVDQIAVSDLNVDKKAVILPVQKAVRRISVLTRVRVSPTLKRRMQAWIWSKRKILLIFATSMVLLIAAILIVKNINRLQQEGYAKKLLPYQQRLNLAKNMLGSDKTQGLLTLRVLDKELTVLEEANKANSAFELQIKKTIIAVESVYSSNSGEQRIPKLNVFFDFRLVAADFISSAIGYDESGKLLVFLDPTHSRILSLSIENKQPQLLSISGQVVPQALAVVNKDAYVVSSEGIVDFTLPLSQLGNVVVPTGGDWQSPKLLGAYGTNVYLLDAQARSLLKYDLTAQNSTSSAWLKNKEGIEFNSISSMQIDGNVFMGTSTGSILKFVQGNSQTFKVSGLLDPFTTALSLYTDQNSQSLYVLEPRAKRIVILSKDGVYKSSILSDDLSSATSLVADEANNTLYVLSGSLVYQIGL